MTKFVVIVDAYSSGALLAPEIKKRGYECLHVQSSDAIPDVFLSGFRAENFQQTFLHKPTENTIEELSQYTCAAILPGTETGVKLADEISSSLHLKSNVARLSEARRNKFAMGEAIRKAGIPALRQARVISVENAREKINKFTYPVVVKPTESAGTDCVTVCKNFAETTSALMRIVDKTNLLGRENHDALVQEYASGTEFMVDTVSYEGKHLLTDIWQYQKQLIPSGQVVYDKTSLLDGESNEAREIFSYVGKCLDAIGLRFGPAHSEVMMTEHGPRFIETGARLGGAGIPVTVKEALNYSQLDATLDAYLEPDKFLARYRESSTYKLKRNAIIVNGIARKGGKLKAFKMSEELHHLPSFFRAVCEVEPGGFIKPTTDLFTSPVCIDLIHFDSKVVEHDYATFRRWETEGFYVTEEGPG